MKLLTAARHFGGRSKDSAQVFDRFQAPYSADTKIFRPDAQRLSGFGSNRCAPAVSVRIDSVVNYRNPFGWETRTPSVEITQIV
jgi:hypothetical protein